MKKINPLNFFFLSWFRLHMKMAVVLLVLSMSGCQREFEIDAPVQEQMVIMNGVLIADSLPVVVRLSWSQEVRPGDTTYPDITDATVSFFENNRFIDTLQTQGDGSYLCLYAPKPDSLYRVEARVGNRLIWGETTIPKPVPVKEISTDSIKLLFNQFSCRCFVTLSDVAEQDDTYWFWAVIKNPVSDEQSLELICSGSPYFDDFAKAGNMSKSFLYQSNYGFMARLPDDNFNGQHYTFDIAPYMVKEYTLYINLFDSHYDKYLKSFLEYTDFIYNTEEYPIFFQPSFVYSNIQNGQGILGSYSSWSFKARL